jgi:hypothetical protein
MIIVQDVNYQVVAGKQHIQAAAILSTLMTRLKRIG